MLLSNKGSAAEKGILTSQTFHLQLVLTKLTKMKIAAGSLCVKMVSALPSLSLFQQHTSLRGVIHTKAMRGLP